MSLTLKLFQVSSSNSCLRTSAFASEIKSEDVTERLSNDKEFFLVGVGNWANFCSTISICDDILVNVPTTKSQTDAKHYAEEEMEMRLTKWLMNGQCLQRGSRVNWLRFAKFKTHVIIGDLTRFLGIDLHEPNADVIT